MIEQIEWIACADRLPDDAMLVLTYTPDMYGVEVLAGWRCGPQWVESGGFPASVDPTHWAAWPGGPKG